MMEKAETQEELRLIVRIVNKDLDGNLPIYRAITKIKGINRRIARMIAMIFERETGIAFDTKVGSLTEDKDKELEKIIANPLEHGIPTWAVNRRKDFWEGNNRHIVMSDLDLELRKDLQRLSMIKSYRGLRHVWGLPTRGQKTKSTHRGKGPVVGVTKKDATAAAKPAATASKEAKPAAAGKAPAKEEKKK